MTKKKINQIKIYFFNYFQLEQINKKQALGNIKQSKQEINKVNKVKQRSINKIVVVLTVRKQVLMNQNQRQSSFQSLQNSSQQNSSQQNQSQQSQNQQKSQQIIRYTAKNDTPKSIEQSLKFLFQYYRKFLIDSYWMQRGQNQIKVQSLSGQQIFRLLSYVGTFEQTEFRIYQCLYPTIGPNFLRSISHITFTNLKSIRFNFMNPDFNYDNYIGCMIYNIEPITYMKLDNLQELCFGYNHINSIKPLAHAHFPALKHLGVFQNVLNHSQMCHLARLTSINLQACLIEQADRYMYDNTVDILYFNDIFKLQSTKINKPFNNCTYKIYARQLPRAYSEKMFRKLLKKYPTSLLSYQEQQDQEQNR